MSHASPIRRHAPASLAALRNVGRATLGDFALLGITDVDALARADADDLYVTLARITGARQDPCVHDVFAATIHQARTGEARNWWDFTPARKARQRDGTFPELPATAR